MKRLTCSVLYICLGWFVTAASGGPKFRSAIFLHHSVGDVIYHGSYENTPVPTTVPLEVAKYNNAHGFSGSTAVTMDEPSTRLFPSPNTSENDWWYWQQILGGSAGESSAFNNFLSSYSIIIVKSCYLSEEFMLAPDSVGTYKAHYRAVVKYMSQHSNFFVIWNNYPAYYTGTGNQLRSATFSKWAKDTLATGKDPVFGAFPRNVYVFDVFRKIADPNSGTLPIKYIIGGGDEHPSNAAVAVITPQFVKEVFDAAIAHETLATPVLESATHVPDQYALRQNYPNPFNPSTKISYDLPKQAMVSLKVFNLLGQEVLDLVNAEQVPGTHEVQLNAQDLSSGVYLYRLQAGTFVQTRKLSLLK